jgi:DNA-binding CsgD family transcriptional regulator
LLFALILCLSFAIYYPKIFSDYKKKDAYWLNYLGIFCFTLLFFLSAAKYFNLFKASTFFDISNKILFVGHIVSLYFAFLLIIKSRLVQKFTNANLFDQESEIGEGRNNESLSVVLASLSEREYIVLELISMGLKDQDIADRLIVSITTIKTHKQRVYKKLNINSRSQATQIFLKFTSKTLNLINN